jgi:hypothetical protein
MRHKRDVFFLIVLSFSLAVSATLYGLSNQTLITYGDSESHLNISKRVTDSLTPGLAQLGGIWLPLPHLLMIPFTSFDWLWQTGIAGAIVSGLSYVAATVFIYLIIVEITKNCLASWFGALVFALNPNILYLQTTAMTEIPLVAFFNGSVYFFLRHIRTGSLQSLIMSAVIGLAATLSRYDGWFLVLFQAAILLLWYLFRSPKSAQSSLRSLHKQLKHNWAEAEAKLLVFGAMAFIGVALWILWDYLILNDPLYFTNSPFSAKSQQQDWLERGELPAYQNLSLSFVYYAITSYVNIGSLVSITAIFGLGLMMIYRPNMQKFIAISLLLVPVIFYTVTLYAGQSIIFIPQLTPAEYEWNLFNVRYGVMMIPAAAIFTAYLLFSILDGRQRFIPQLFLNKRSINTVSAMVMVGGMVGILLMQQYRFLSQAEPVISYEDGVNGLSASRSTDAETWIKNEYDGGYILVDDYARTLSIIRSGLPMDKVIYVGNKPYWEESFKEPEKYARWIIMQDGDSIWNNLYENEAMQGRVYTYFEKAYTSPQILIFKRSAGSGV